MKRFLSDYLDGFRPRLGPTLMTLAMVGVLLTLGTWQVERLAWKTELLSHMDAQLAQPPVDLPTVVPSALEWDYRPVVIEGRFIHEKEMYMPARSFKHNNPGYQVLTPFVRESGAVVLVNRGWVPLDKKDPASRADGQYDQPVRLTGIARVPPKQGYFQPDNRVDLNFWYFVDLKKMAQYTDIAEFFPVVVELATSGGDAVYPLAGQTRINLSNNHLAYAVTWYGLALILLVMYVISQRRDDTPPAP